MYDNVKDVLLRGEKMEGRFFTDRGNVRNHNEDAGGIFLNVNNQPLLIVADGMGGHKAGDVASDMTISMIKELWEDVDYFSTPEMIEEWLQKVLAEVNTVIYEKANNNDAFIGMGTTVVIAVCIDDFISVAHIGDSRCYILNRNGFNQITEDHSLVSALVRSGQITEEEAQHHPRKNIVLKSLGSEENVHADIHSLGWEAGDRLLLCSDGLSDKMTNNELETWMKKDEHFDTIGQQLIDLANERGGEDNISLIIVHHDANGKEGETSC